MRIQVILEDSPSFYKLWGPKGQGFKKNDEEKRKEYRKRFILPKKRTWVKPYGRLTRDRKKWFELHPEDLPENQKPRERVFAADMPDDQKDESLLEPGSELNR